MRITPPLSSGPLRAGSSVTLHVSWLLYHLLGSMTSSTRPHRHPPTLDAVVNRPPPEPFIPRVCSPQNVSSVAHWVCWFSQGAKSQIGFQLCSRRNGTGCFPITSFLHAITKMYNSSYFLISRTNCTGAFTSRHLVRQTLVQDRLREVDSDHSRANAIRLRGEPNLTRLQEGNLNVGDYGMPEQAFVKTDRCKRYHNARGLNTKLTMNINIALIRTRQTDCGSWKHPKNKNVGIKNVLYSEKEWLIASTVY